MEILDQQPLFVCGACKQSLPAEAFYLNKRSGLPANYCIECRKAASRTYRNHLKSFEFKAQEVDYPVITCMEDSVQRQILLKNALENVADQVKRKRKARYDSESEDDI